MRTYLYTFHALDDEDERVGVLFDDSLDRGLDRWRTDSRVTWVDVHGPGGFRRVYVHETNEPHADWVPR